MTWVIDKGRDSERRMLAARRRLRGDPNFTPRGPTVTMEIKHGDAPVANVEMGETRGTATFLNWERLNAMLRRQGIIGDKEYIKGVNINEAGFGIYLGDDNDPLSDTYEKPLGE